MGVMGSSQNTLLSLALPIRDRFDQQTGDASDRRDQRCTDDAIVLRETVRQSSRSGSRLAIRSRILALWRIVLFFFFVSPSAAEIAACPEFQTFLSLGR